jgi:hypothetical protein
MFPVPHFSDVFSRVQLKTKLYTYKSKYTHTQTHHERHLRVQLIAIIIIIEYHYFNDILLKPTRSLTKGNNDV